MLAAKPTELLQFQTRFNGFFVLMGMMANALTLRAFQLDHVIL